MSSRRTRTSFLQIAYVLYFVVLVLVFVVGYDVVLNKHHTGSKVAFILGLIPLLGWVGVEYYRIIAPIVDGNLENDNYITSTRIIAVFIYYFFLGAYAFMAFWVVDPTRYWSGMPSWDQEHSGLLAFVGMLFTSVLSNGVGFGPIYPIHWASQLLYAAFTGSLYVLNVLALVQGATIAINNRTKLNQGDR